MGVFDKYVKKKFKKKPVRKPTKEEFSRTGIEKKTLSDKQKESLLDYLTAGSNIQDLAPLFNMCGTTLRRIIKDEMGIENEDWPLDTLENQVEKARAMCGEDLRIAQMNNAMDGNATMQIYLGKQILRQTDRPDLREEKEKQIEVYPTIKDHPIEQQIKYFLENGMRIPRGVEMLFEIAKLKGEFGTDGGLEDLKDVPTDELVKMVKQ